MTQNWMEGEFAWLKIAVDEGQGHHLLGLGPAQGPDHAGGLALGQGKFF